MLAFLLVAACSAAWSQAPEVDKRAAALANELRCLAAALAAGTRAPGDYDRGRREIEARFLEDVAAAPEPAPARRSRTFVAVLAAVIPALALGLYFLVGNPGALSLEVEHQANARQL